MSDFDRYPVSILSASTAKNPNMRCTLTVSPRFTANLAPDCPLHPATAAYAAYRLLGWDQDLQQFLVPISYRLRLAKGRGRKSRALWLRLNATWFGLGLTDADVYVRLLVDAAGVAVERVELLPCGSRPPHPLAACQPRSGDIPLLVLQQEYEC